MTGGDALALGMTQRVQHAVVWMDGRKSVLVQLILHDVDQLLHPSIVVRPITDDLTHNKTVSDNKLISTHT